MTPVNVATIIVALIAGISAWAAQKAAAKASEKNTTATTRVDMEKDAYERARAFDTETITRQDDRIKDLELENAELHKEIRMLRARTARLERALGPLNLEALHDDPVPDDHAG